MTEKGTRIPELEPDLSTCPNCGGNADNGHDRCIPPSPYPCSMCVTEDERNPNLTGQLIKQECHHDKYAEFCGELAELLKRKQEAYGNSFGKCGEILRTLYPNGVRLSQYDNLLALIRIVDKLFRLASHDADTMGESPGRDIAGYGVLVAMMHKGGC